MVKLTKFAGSISVIAMLLMIRCPSLRPDTRPFINSVGRVFGLYPKSAVDETSKKSPSFYFDPITDKGVTKALVHELNSR